MSAFVSGATTGRFSAEDKAWFADRGPAQPGASIRIPTLLIQGTPDTLFTPSEAMRNYELLERAGVPTTPSGARPTASRCRPGRRWPPLAAEGKGTLILTPADTASGTLISAGPALGSVVQVPIRAPAARTDDRRAVARRRRNSRSPSMRPLTFAGAADCLRRPATRAAPPRRRPERRGARPSRASSRPPRPR
jgi:hypothetical protein